MHFLQAINSDISVLIVCNKTGGTIKGDKKKLMPSNYGNERQVRDRYLHACSLLVTGGTHHEGRSLCL